MKDLDAVVRLRQHFAQKFPPTEAELSISYANLTDAEFEAELIRPLRHDERRPPALYSECQKRFGIDASEYWEGHRTALKAARTASIRPWKWWQTVLMFPFTVYYRCLGF